MSSVDERQETQFLAPEFELFRELFMAHGITAVIADPGELAWRDERLWCGATAILTDSLHNLATWD